MTPELAQYQNARGQSPERIASDQHRVALDQVFQDSQSKAPDLDTFKAILSKADARISQILGEVERIPSGESSIQVQAKGREKFNLVDGVYCPELGVVTSADGKFIITDADGNHNSPDGNPTIKLPDGNKVKLDGYYEYAHPERPKSKPSPKPKPNLPPKTAPGGPAVTGVSIPKTPAAKKP
jgi:hypothetical protein